MRFVGGEAAFGGEGGFAPLIFGAENFSNFAGAGVANPPGISQVATTIFSPAGHTDFRRKSNMIYL